MKKILILLALEAELGAENVARLKSVADVCYLGVGKLSAFEATLRAMAQADYDAVINIGTCGSQHHPYATILRPNVVAQGDIYVDSIFATPAEQLSTGEGEVAIYSSDNFIGEDTSAATRKIVDRFDCMDMESYAVVRALRFHAEQSGTPCPALHLIKVVSDKADGTISSWESRIAPLREPLLCEAMKLIEELKKQ